MSLIFDGFPTRSEAEAFVVAARSRYGLEGEVFDTPEASDAHDPFPFELVAPIVHVERAPEGIEKHLTNLLTEFGGRFAGT